MADLIERLDRLAEELADGLGARTSLRLSDATRVDIEGAPFLAVVVDAGQRFALLPLDPASDLRPSYPDLGRLLGGADRLSVLDEDRPLRLEGVAVEGGCLVVTGSAALERSRPRRDEDRADAMARLGAVSPASGRGNHHSDYVFRLELRLEEGRAKVRLANHWEIRSPLLYTVAVLAPFAQIPAEDNGLAVEGIAVRGDDRWLGLRSPVLHGHALLVRFDPAFARAIPYPLDLGGDGIRALRWAETHRYGSGLFLVSGAALTRRTDFQIWRYTPDNDLEARGNLTPMGTLDASVSSVQGLFCHEGDLYAAVDGRAGGAPRVVRFDGPAAA